MRRLIFSAGLMAGLALAGGTAAQQPDPLAAPPSAIEGTWRTQSQTEITIAPCELGFCGTISRIVVPEDIAEANKEALATMSPEDFLDANNKDPALRSRPIQGLQILTLQPGKDATIFDGEIYNPQDGNTYSGYIQVLAVDMLRLNGCVLYNIICRGEDWMRVPEPVEAAITQ